MTFNDLLCPNYDLKWSLAKHDFLLAYKIHGRADKKYIWPVHFLKLTEVIILGHKRHIQPKITAQTPRSRPRPQARP